MASMRIAYINADPGVPVFGTKGSALHVREIIDGFIKAGATVHLFASRLDGQIPAAWQQVRLHPLTAPEGASHAQGEQAVLMSNRTLRNALIDAGEQFDLIYERFSLWSFAAMEYARERQMASVLEVNAPLIEEQKVYRALSDEAAAESAMHRALMAARNILAVSDEVARYVAGKIPADKKICVVPNAINPARFPANLQPACRGSLDSFTVGFVGSLRPWHGLSILMEAFHQVRETLGSARLLIVGDGPEREAITRNVHTRGLANATIFAGAVPSDLVPGYLASMDVTVAPYPNLPNFYFSPLKVYEYMAAGRAVVVSQIGQLKTLITHGVNGWHVPAGDPQALAKAILHLAHHDQLRKQLGKAARQTVLQNHTWDQVVQRIFEMTGLAREVQPRDHWVIQPV